MDRNQQENQMIPGEQQAQQQQLMTDDQQLIVNAPNQQSGDVNVPEALGQQQVYFSLQFALFYLFRRKTINHPKMP